MAALNTIMWKIILFIHPHTLPNSKIPHIPFLTLLKNLHFIKMRELSLLKWQYSLSHSFSVLLPENGERFSVWRRRNAPKYDQQNPRNLVLVTIVAAFPHLYFPFLSLNSSSLFPSPFCATLTLLFPRAEFFQRLSNLS